MRDLGVNSPTIEVPNASAEFDIPVIVTSRRFVVLAIYILYGLGNQFQYVGNANVIDQLAPYLDCSKFAINGLAIVFALIYVVGAFPACEVFSRLGLRRALLLGLGCNGLGAVLKAIAVLWYREYWLVIVGQGFAGVGQIFFLALPPLLAATWFPTDERSVATALGTLSGFLGMALGFAIAPAVVNEDRQSRGDFGALYGGQAVYCVANLLACVFLVPAHPKHPPSVTSPQFLQIRRALLQQQQATAAAAAAAAVTSNDPAARLLSDSRAQQQAEDAYDAAKEREMLEHQMPAHVFAVVWQQRHNKSFVWLVVVFGIGAGSMTAVSAVFAQMVSPYGIDEKQAGNVLLASILAGCVACVVCGPLLDKYRRYRMPLFGLLVALIAICAALLAFMITIKTSAAFEVILFIITPLLVICLLPTLPIGLELAVELTYPLPEAIPATACMWANGLFTLIGTGAASAILGDNPGRAEAQFIMGGVIFFVAVCAGVMFFVVVENRKRFDHEQATNDDGGEEVRRDKQMMPTPSAASTRAPGSETGGAFRSARDVECHSAEGSFSELCIAPE